MGRNIGTRVNLTLPPEIMSVIDRICSVSGTGRASFIRQMLIEITPHLESVALGLEQAKANNLDAFKTLSRAVDEVRAQTDQMGLDLKKSRRMMRKKKPHE